MNVGNINVNQILPTIVASDDIIVLLPHVTVAKPWWVTPWRKGHWWVFYSCMYTIASIRFIFGRTLAYATKTITWLWRVPPVVIRTMQEKIAQNWHNAWKVDKCSKTWILTIRCTQSFGNILLILLTIVAILLSSLLRKLWTSISK